jgi:hypothetical protein
MKLLNGVHIFFQSILNCFLLHVCVYVVILTLRKLYNFIKICARYFDKSIMKECEFVLYSSTRTD